MAHKLKQKFVRVNCGATGVDIGYGWGMFVSAQDNELCIDKINTSPDAEPPMDDPVYPSDEASSAAKMVMRSLAYYGGLK